MTDYQIQTRGINEIKPYKNNAKLHPQEQIDKICRSIALTGFDQPIVINSNNIIIKGHGRLLAAKQLGLTDVPVIVLDVPDAVADKARLIDNKAGESEYDLDLLVKELTKFSEEITDTGYDTEEFNKLVMKLEDETAIANYDWDSLATSTTVFDKKETKTNTEQTQKQQSVNTSDDTTDDVPDEDDPATEEEDSVVIRAYLSRERAELVWEVLGINQETSPIETGEALWQICQQ